MSQKAICPRGHIWDPSTLAGLPPTERPRCPICGEEEPMRVRYVLRVERGASKSPSRRLVRSVSSPRCRFGGISFSVRRRAQAAPVAAEQALFAKQQAEASSSPAVADVADDKEPQHNYRRNERQRDGRREGSSRPTFAGRKSRPRSPTTAGRSNPAAEARRRAGADGRSGAAGSVESRRRWHGN